MRGRHGGSRCRRRSFTLIELLVVIAIIALLVAILVPALSRVRHIARSVKCSTNVHAMARATHLYAADNDNWIPRDTYGANQFFAAKLARYLGTPGVPWDQQQNADTLYDLFKSIRVYQCPSVTSDDFALMYTVNSIDFDYYKKTGNYTAAPTSEMDKVPGSAAAILYITEINDQRLQPKGYDVWDIWHSSHMSFYAGAKNSDPRMIHADDMRHDGRTTIVCLDGHAEQRELTAKDLPVHLFNPLDDN